MLYHKQIQRWCHVYVTSNEVKTALCSWRDNSANTDKTTVFYLYLGLRIDVSPLAGGWSFPFLGVYEPGQGAHKLFRGTGRTLSSLAHHICLIREQVKSPEALSQIQWVLWPDWTSPTLKHTQVQRHQHPSPIAQLNFTVFSQEIEKSKPLVACSSYIVL